MFSCWKQWQNTILNRVASQHSGIVSFALQPQLLQYPWGQQNCKRWRSTIGGICQLANQCLKLLIVFFILLGTWPSLMDMAPEMHTVWNFTRRNGSGSCTCCQHGPGAWVAPHWPNQNDANTLADVSCVTGPWCLVIRDYRLALYQPLAPLAMVLHPYRRSHHQPGKWPTGKAPQNHGSILIIVILPVVITTLRQTSPSRRSPHSPSQPLSLSPPLTWFPSAGYTVACGRLRVWRLCQRCSRQPPPPPPPSKHVSVFLASHQWLP